MSTNIFEQASRLKLRIFTPAGNITVEDLWDLPLTSKSGAVNLDDLARGFSRKLKSQAEESFVERPASKEPTLELGFDIIKYVIDVRLAEAETKKEADARRAHKKRLADIIAQKRDNQLSEKSLEELEAELKGL